MARSSKSKTDAAQDRSRVTAAVLALAADGRWGECTVASVAEATGLSRARVMRYLPCKAAALALIADHVDSTVLDDTERDPIDLDGDPKDRLFDALMRRFDTLQDDRDGATALFRAALRDPAAASCAAARSTRSMRLMLELCGISAAGPLGLVRIKGLTLVYARTLRAWVNDDSPDMAKTMSMLDKALSQGERIMGRLTPPWHRQRSTVEPTDPKAGSSAE